MPKAPAQKMEFVAPNSTAFVITTPQGSIPFQKLSLIHI